MRTTMIGVGTMTLLLALVLVSVHIDSRPPRTAQEAISVVLRQQGIAFEEVRVENGRCLPTPEQCSEYRADVVAIAGQPRRGLMQCWHIDQDCELWIADLGLDARLPDLVQPPAWVGEIEALWRAAAMWVRQIGSHLRSLLSNPGLKSSSSCDATIALVHSSCECEETNTQYRRRSSLVDPSDCVSPPFPPLPAAHWAAVSDSYSQDLRIRRI